MTDDWMELAACKGEGATMSDHSPDGIAKALTMCHGWDRITDPCPVMRRCAKWAVEQPMGYDGVAGGHWLVNGKRRRPPRPVRFRETAPTPREVQSAEAHLCSDCGQTMLLDGQAGPGVKHKARGLCRHCWLDHDAAGTLHQFTREARTSVSVVEDYEFLVGAGYTREEIAERLGIKVGSLMHALRRAGKKAA